MSILGKSQMSLKKIAAFWGVLWVCTLPLFSQQTNLDCKIIDIGPLRQTITNMATFGSGFTGCANDQPYASHIAFSAIRNHFNPGWSEYPKGSNCWYLDFGPWIGGIRDGRTIVITGGPDNLFLEQHGAFQAEYELFPTAAPWDTIWVVKKGETVDIPYWPNYTGVSDQDMVCRFNDYTLLNIPNHVPLFVDIIQVTYAWISLEFLVHQYWLIPTREPLEDVYFGFKGECSIGCATTGSLDQGVKDEFGWYDEERNFGLETDLPGSNDDECCTGPIGFKIMVDGPEDEVSWNWYDGQRNEEHPNTDIGKYFERLKTGIQHFPLQDNSGIFFYSVGPYDLNVGDTLHISLGQIYGQGEEGVYTNLDRLLQLREMNYQLPSPPPDPPLRIEADNQQITLRWNPQAGDVDPETFRDENRGDGDLHPFEGYRVYKSTVSNAGPWTLLAEYDLKGNEFGSNTGLVYEYVDTGLLNNLEYYYAVTAFARPDKVLGLTNLESSLTANARLAIPGTASPETVGQVAVVPNPYRGDEKYYTLNPQWEKTGTAGIWTEELRRIQFINLSNPSTIIIYTVSGKFVTKLEHNDPERGFEDWNLTSEVGQAIASGVYLFTVMDAKGNVQTGKFVVIK